ncbi:hypothetical protein [Psychroserpens damuponensis]|uniref:hypothetical protein n=1 Tax=Psychroserpens damuponensis TaxID=943936 RepID=UPI0005913F6E|nr:hypothetical protein [Psychroserpens damuponensis]
MKAFFKNIVITLVTFYILLFVLDVIYTTIYNHPIKARSKVTWLRSLEPNQELDYALFGSSRVFFHLNPVQIKKETGLNGINLSYPAADNFEIKLMVKEFFKKHRAKKIFVQVDDRYNVENFNKLAINPWIPFIKEDSIYNDIKAVDSAAVYKRYLPFYRYMLSDSRLGFREIVLSFFKPNMFEATNGFAPMVGQINENSKPMALHIIDKKNQHLETIIDICKKEKVELFFFTAPYFNTQLNTEVLKKQLPNYHDFYSSISDINCFSDHLHLNEKGAKQFTTLFSDTYFKN